MFRWAGKEPESVVFRLVRCALIACLAVPFMVHAAEPPALPEDPAGGGPPAGPATAPAPGLPQELTLWDMMENGGPVLWIILGLSVLTVMMTIYLFFTVTVGREVPPNFMRRALALIHAGDLRGAYQMCEGRSELLARVIRVGIRMNGHDRYVIQEAMESEGERGATALWQKISYLNNIGVIAPLLGLLGTVLGMIQAFASHAAADHQVKSLYMSYAVSQAMLTTAAGLMLAIPAMVVFFYLRGRVTKIIAEVEAQASEVVEALTRSQ